MIDARYHAEAAKVLSECGYSELSELSVSGLESVLSAAQSSVFRELGSAVPDPNLIDVFRIKYDYHNAKVLVKAVATGAQPAALLMGGGEAVTLCLSLAGAYAFFGGMLEVLRQSGAADALSRLLGRGLARLFRFAPGEEAALGDMSVNLSCNMLGMGSAATAAGLSAMRRLAAEGSQDGQASEAMILFFVLNSACIDLLPTTMIALRAQYGAANPADIILPTVVSTTVSAVTGVVLCRVFAGGRGKCVRA